MPVKADDILLVARGWAWLADFPSVVPPSHTGLPEWRRPDMCDPVRDSETAPPPHPSLKKMNARFGNMMATIYYTLVNLLASLGSLVLMMVAHWLFKWATVSVMILVLLVVLA